MPRSSSRATGLLILASLSNTMEEFRRYEKEARENNGGCGRNKVTSYAYIPNSEAKDMRCAFDILMVSSLPI